MDERTVGKGALSAPFPYFGGKKSIASIVWQALGQPAHYLEPFFGSGAVLLARPGGAQGTETVNDKDGFIANVWRGIQFSPDEVAKWCDWPINHADLCSRRAELIRNEERLLQNLIADPKWHDPVLAGYWIWAASCWIGSGLTSPKAIPHLSDTTGIHTAGKRQRLTGFADAGIHAVAAPPHVSNKGMSICSAKSSTVYAWMNALSDRLRNVRVVWGDWTQICGGNWQDRNGVAGMFFDPPYSVTTRDTAVYHHDSITVAQDVNAWVLERGKKPTYRIVLTGYREEHKNLLDHGWTEQTWKANGGYGNQSKSNGRTGNQNENRETIFFSPHCVQGQGKLDL